MKVGMNIDDSIYWDLYRSVGDKFCRGIDGIVDIEIDDESINGDGNVVKL